MLKTTVYDRRHARSAADATRLRHAADERHAQPRHRLLTVDTPVQPIDANN